jgi:hypothetical protein
MNKYISKSNSSALSTLDRLGEVRMHDSDRLIAAAHLARAEAIADLAARGWEMLAKGLRAVFLRPYARRPVTSN